jgi:hypothetical protein
LRCRSIIIWLFGRPGNGVRPRMPSLRLDNAIRHGFVVGACLPLL